MCPLRIILVFLSGLVAGYFAWKTFRTETDEARGPPQSNSNTEDAASQKSGLLKKCAPRCRGTRGWAFRVPRSAMPALCMNLRYASQASQYLGSCSNCFRILDICGYGKWKILVAELGHSRPQTK